MWTSKQLGTRPRTRTTQIHFLELELKPELRRQMTTGHIRPMGKGFSNVYMEYYVYMEY